MCATVCVVLSEIVTAMVTCPVVTLQGQRWSHEIGVHWLGAILTHLLLWGHVGRRGGLCVRKEAQRSKVSFCGGKERKLKNNNYRFSPGIWNGLPGSELDGE